MRLLVGDVLEQLRTLTDGCVQCVVTSPPYWGLRDYGVSGQLGLEPTPEAYLAHMVAVFAEVRRVLRDDGTLWLNMGDCYATGAGKVGACPGGGEQGQRWKGPRVQANRMPIRGLKPKDLIGMPWRLAFALQADGWWLRQDVIWHKPSPMPESVADRCTKAHEYIFLLTKRARYYYDAVAISEPATDTGRLNGRDGRIEDQAARPPGSNPRTLKRLDYSQVGRNARSVWTIASEAYPQAHFATFPRELPRRCILAGTSAKGACAACGKPWVRVTRKSGGTTGRDWNTRRTEIGGGDLAHGAGKFRDNSIESTYRVEDLGFQPACECNAETMPCVVLDPFAGSGTTLEVAAKLGREAIGIELNPEYAALARARLGLFAEVCGA